MPLVERLGVPLVTTFHGHDATRTDADLAAGSRSDRLYLRRRPDLARAGARFLAVSAFIADALVELGFPSDRVEVHHIGVDVEAIQRATANVERERGLVLFVGRLVAQKGVDDLAGALTQLGRVDDLVVIGDGAERRSLEAVAPQARFLGAQDQREVWRWMARASVVVVPSKTGATGAREAFGLVAAEAQAAGTPVVATTNGGLPEAIAPSLQQLQVPEGDVDALADAIDRAAGVADAAVEARAWIAVERNLARQNERLDAIYRKVAP
jgi:glycosyltransferase involved in cell wall biosynthesis